MFNQPYGYNPNQPYGFNPYMQQNMQQSSQQPTQQSTMPTNTNKIFVSSINDVKNRQLPFNSDFIFLDNDKPILYQKIVSSTGQYEVKTFDITPHNDLQDTKEVSSVDLSNYISKSEFEALNQKLQDLENQLKEIRGNNGN